MPVFVTHGGSGIGYDGAMIRYWRKVREFIAEDLWRIDASSLPRMSAFGLHCLRVTVQVIEGIRRDKLRVHASALTFSTLMSLVPFLALSFAVLKGLGYGGDLTTQLTELLAGFPEQFQGLSQQVIDAVNKTDFTKLGGVGGLILLLMSIEVLSRIESSFNSIWGISSNRRFLRKMSQYVSVTVVVPILLMSAITLTATYKLNQGIFERLGLLKLTPFMTVWVAFWFLNGFMPNTRVKMLPSLVSGLFAAILWQGWFQLYITLQPGVTKYNVIYGTIASIPIFLAWLYVSWVIVLVGAEIAFSMQNITTIQMEHQSLNASFRSKVMLVMAVLLRAAYSLHGRRERFSLPDYAVEKKIPIRLLHDVADLLAEKGYLAQAGEDSDNFVLTMAPERVNLGEVVDLVLQRGEDPTALGIDHVDLEVNEMVGHLQSAMTGSLTGRTLKDLMTPDPESSHEDAPGS